MGCINCCCRRGFDLFGYTEQIAQKKSPRPSTEQREGIPLLVEGFAEEWDFDDPLFTHGNGIANMLETLHERGVGSSFEPLAEEFEKVLLEARSHQYEPVLDSPDLKIAERKDEESGLLVMKVLNIVPGATVHRLCTIIHDVKLREQWEKKHTSSGLSATLVCTNSPDDQTYLLQYPGVLFSKGREFLDRRITYRHPKGHLVVQLSGAGDAECPENNKFIRAVTVFQLDVWYATPEGAARYMCILGDPKGTLPQSVVNYVSKSAPKKWHKALLKAYAEFTKNPDK